MASEARYFNQSAQSTLASSFDNVEEHNSIDGRTVIVECGPGMAITAFYRARVFQNDRDLEEAMKRPDIELGPPPPPMASARRMNARGISVFYGATDPDVTVAEVRPPVGSKVLLGRFGIARTIRLLDVTALESVRVRGSLFDRTLSHRLEKADFLATLSKRISMPVLPSDEPFDYLATQAVADFLAAEIQPPLDGILYPAVQVTKGAMNVVLFHKSARVARFAIPAGTEVSATLYQETDDGNEIDCWVTEETPQPASQTAIDTGSAPGPGPTLRIDSRKDFAEITDDFDPRPTILALDAASIEVRLVKGVTFATEVHSVRRHRFERSHGRPF